MLSALAITTNTGILNPQRALDTLSEYFGVAKILIGNAVANANNTGAALNNAAIWTDNVFVARTVGSSAPSGGGGGAGDIKLETTAGIVVEAYPWTLDTYRDEDKATEYQRLSYMQDEVVVQALAGTLLINTQT